LTDNPACCIAHPSILPPRLWHGAAKGLNALDDATNRTDYELRFAVAIIPGHIHVIQYHIDPLGIVMRKHLP
jgi:hypothetical protein